MLLASFSVSSPTASGAYAPDHPAETSGSCEYGYAGADACEYQGGGVVISLKSRLLTFKKALSCEAVQHS
jgi:hypothetical protein